MNNLIDTILNLLFPQKPQLVKVKTNSNQPNKGGHMSNSYFITAILLGLILFIINVNAQTTARLQVIHNAADPAAESVDVYLDGTLLLDDFGFREATSFIDAPANQAINVGIAPGTSSSVDDTLKNFVFNLAEGGTYVAVANGVLDPGSFTANPDGRDIAFTIFGNDMAREAATTMDNVDFFVLHGSTDAPTVDVIARDVATLVDNAAYGDMTDYISVPPASYLLDVTPGDDNETIVATFEADLSGLAGGAAVVFASGFLAPVEGQPAFGIYAALPTGDVVAFEAKTTARLQVIHNAADPAADSVDVYLNDDLLLDNFAFRTATPFIDAPANQDIRISVAPANSASSADSLKQFNVNFLAEETYVGIANGVLDPEGFTANPDGRDIAFTIFGNDMAREAATSMDNVDFFVLHGSTDAPTVDVIARDVATLVDNAAYGDMTDYISVPPASYLLDVTPGNDNETIVATFEADLSGLAGGAAVVFASGFLAPAEGQPAFGIYAALHNGTVVTFGLVTSINDDFNNSIVNNFELAQNYPNPFNPSTTITFAIPQKELVSVKVYNLVGQEVATLVNGEYESGVYKVNFDAGQLGSGIYFYTITAGDFKQTRKMTLLK
jgi:hypothetical protein